MKKVRITVTGAANSPDANAACRQTMKPFVDKGIEIEIVFTSPSNTEERVVVKIEPFGVSLLRHQRMIEPGLAEELERVRTRIGLGGSTQFEYVKDQSEATAAAVLGR